MDGVLIIDKPAGITSHDVVARCRRILGNKKIGHTGTLDPFATGVMVILVGKATRLARFLDNDEKVYEAIARFGFETDTGDATGEPRKAFAAPPAGATLAASVEAVLPEFVGDILQTPPMYSAKKIEGKKLYELARKGIEVERRAVPVTISRLGITEANGVGEIGFRVVCSAGTYIRTLAEDIARRAGSASHLVALRRTRAGRFGIESALTTERLEQVAASGELGEHLIPMSDAVSHLAAVMLDDERIAKTKNGLASNAESESASDGDEVRIVDGYGELVAIGTYDAAAKRVQPRLVLV